MFIKYDIINDYGIVSSRVSWSFYWEIVCDWLRCKGCCCGFDIVFVEIWFEISSFIIGKIDKILCIICDVFCFGIYWWFMCFIRLIKNYMVVDVICVVLKSVIGSSYIIFYNWVFFVGKGGLF